MFKISVQFMRHLFCKIYNIYNTIELFIIYASQYIYMHENGFLFTGI